MTFSIEISGVVQGVGFRPFIYNLAVKMGLKGKVSNNGCGVLVLLEVPQEMADEFIKNIKKSPPPLSEIESIRIKKIKKRESFTSFSIEKTSISQKLTAKIPSDVAMCQECQDELMNKDNRRFEYPFITCTNCGPRYSIIRNLPYDRKNTSMDEFVMCKKCEIEYNNPDNRRYHAQPIGCFECGPTLSILDKNSKKVESVNIIDTVARFISDGKIVAIKGIGGYHLVCDATNDEALKLLRERKNRPSKPFAVMVKDIESSKEIALMNKKEEALLSSIRRPIVLLKKAKKGSISTFVAPCISQVGVFLAYTPLHYLILDRLKSPIVATSANISGEPLSIDREEIMKLSCVWDYTLEHNREIVNSCDDSVAFVENDKIFMLRGARGYTPAYLKLPYKTDEKILSLGANQKSTVSITVDDNIILTPYIGDLNTLLSLKRFDSHVQMLKRIYNFTPNIIVCDKHPSYESTKYAKEFKKQNPNIKLFQIQHHYAHIAATMGLNNIETKVLGVSFDGTGYGDDGNLWGGEFFVCDSSSYERVGHFKYFRLLGGEVAVKEPRRVALSFLFEIYGKEAFVLDNPTINSFSPIELRTLFKVWQKGLNSPLSSSCGRVFDAVASILNIIQLSSYDGESGLLLESMYDERVLEWYKFSVKNNEINFSEIFKQVLEERDKYIAVSKFFNTIIEIIFYMYKKYKLPLVISGGVFQNRVLLRLIMKKIPDVVLPQNFLINDSAIAYGQAIAALEFKTS